VAREAERAVVEGTGEGEAWVEVAEEGGWGRAAAVREAVRAVRAVGRATAEATARLE
jgi:hypothetical protein